MCVKPGTLLHRPAQNAWKHIDRGSPVGLQSQYKPTGVMIDCSPATLLSSVSSCPPSMLHLPRPCSLRGFFFLFSPSRHSAVCGNVSKQDQDPINTLCSSHLTLECITDHIRTSPAKPEKHIFHLTLAFKNKLQTAWIKLYALSTKEDNLQKIIIIIK